MSAAADATIRRQLERIESGLSEREVRAWNGSAWGNLISILAGLGHLDCDYTLDVSPVDREIAARIVRRALGFAYLERPIVLRALLPREPVDFWASRERKLPSLRGILGRLIPEEQARLYRYKVLAAHVLRRYEADRSWIPSESEAVEAFSRFGLP